MSLYFRELLRQRFTDLSARLRRSSYALPPQAARYGTLMYVEAPYSSLDWATAPDWDRTGLSFPSKVVQARDVGFMARRIVAPGWLHESQVQAEVANMTSDMVGVLLVECAGKLLEFQRDGEGKGTVIDSAGVRYEIHMEITIRAQARTWPAIEGVTVPRKDTTW